MSLVEWKKQADQAAIDAALENKRDKAVDQKKEEIYELLKRFFNEEGFGVLRCTSGSLIATYKKLEIEVTILESNVLFIQLDVYQDKKNFPNNNPVRIPNKTIKIKSSTLFTEDDAIIRDLTWSNAEYKDFKLLELLGLVL